MTQEIEFKDKLKTEHEVKISVENQTLLFIGLISILSIWMIKRKK